MPAMLEQVLAHLNNWFCVGVYPGRYTAGDWTSLPFLQPGQYFRVVGSVFNDGLYRYPALGRGNETFEGEIWALAVPEAVRALAIEIEAWQAKHGAAAQSPYQSESFGGYSYTKATDAATGGPLTWEKAFRPQLNRWRKL